MFYMHMDINFRLLFQSLHLITSGQEAPMMRRKVIVICRLGAGGVIAMGRV